MSETERTVETTGPNVEEAIAAGLEELQVNRDLVDIEILDEGSRGVFGLGARDASVRLTVKPQPVPRPPDTQLAPPTAGPEAVEAAPEIDKAEKSETEIARGALLELLTMMGLEDVRVDVRKAEAAAGERDTPLVFDVRGPDVSVLIGRRGETLAALQLIARLIVGQETARRADLIVDVDGYKARREESLRRLAQRLAEQAVRTNRRVVLEPMPPHERRIVHLTLRDHQKVTTESIGEGDRRKVTIIPRNQ
ncbi:MAG: protein jag [Anaerolineae bacterium]|nr:protein jag [Anaerolineae bacterium]